MPRREIIGKLEENPRLHPPGVIASDAQIDGKAVNRTEGGIQSVIHQQIGVVIQQIHGAVTIELIGSYRQLRRKMVHGKEFYQLTHTHL